MGLEPGKTQPPRRRPFTWWEVAALAAFLMWAGSEYLDFRWHEQRAAYERAAEQRGYTSRAVTCDLAKSIGSDEPDGCDSPALRPYRSRTLQANSTAGARASAKTHALVCAALASSPDPHVQRVHSELCIR